MIPYGLNDFQYYKTGAELLIIFVMRERIRKASLTAFILF